MLAGTGRRGTRSRNLAVVFTQTSATDDSRPACASRRAQRGPSRNSASASFSFWLIPRTKVWARDLFGVPVGPAEKRRALRGSRRALSESSQSKTVMTSCAAAEETEHRRVVVRSTTGTVGACFLLVPFGSDITLRCAQCESSPQLRCLGEARKGTRQKRNLAVQRRNQVKDTGFPLSRE
jgi:hypothetical protein